MQRVRTKMNEKMNYFIFIPGEDGRPIITDLNSPEVRKANSEYGFNTVASDKASLNRSIPDVRMEECKVHSLHLLNI